METAELIKRLKDNYKVLSVYYQQGRFEDRVPVTDQIGETGKFFIIPTDKVLFRFTDQKDPPQGKGRNSRDLGWATATLRRQAKWLYDRDTSNKGIAPKKRREVVLYYYRILSLSYEVSDYFLEVAEDDSGYLRKCTKEITQDLKAYLEKYSDLFASAADEKKELIKQILIVALCGVNEFYRKHDYREGLSNAETLKSLIDTLPESEGRWFGLKGLCSYVTGKIQTALGKFGEAEKEFRHSVEAYSESVWQKERAFSKYREEMRDLEAAVRGETFDKEKYSRRVTEFKKIKEAHELSRGVALRRSGLASSFGYAFQSLVIGKVKNAIRMSALARGVVNRNTGKIYSSYVDLIYYSAKRAEDSSNRGALLKIKKNLMRCYRVFKDLIPAAHYKNRALFQISLVDHYLARWHKQKGMAQPVGPARSPNLKRAQNRWAGAVRCLRTTIDDETLRSNKRLRAESMAILGHVLSNLALLSIHLGGDGEAMMKEAETLLVEAWEEAEQHPHIQCEVGLAQAAVGKSKAEFYTRFASDENITSRADLINAIPLKREELHIFREALSLSRRILYKVLDLNNGESVRVEATAYLRLTEIALMQPETRLQAREHYRSYLEISSQVEHDFCERWAAELKGRVSDLDKLFTFTIEPGGRNSDPPELKKMLEEFYNGVAINAAIEKIQRDMPEEGSKKNEKSVTAYLRTALKDNFNIPASSLDRWIKTHKLVEKLIEICPEASALKKLGSQRKGRKGKSFGKASS